MMDPVFHMIPGGPRRVALFSHAGESDGCIARTGQMPADLDTPLRVEPVPGGWLVTASGRLTGIESPATWHSHALHFQIVYVTQGWVVFEYDGPGEHMLRAGSCVLQTPGIKHRELRHSDDLELIEITSPAEFSTHQDVDTS